MPSKSRSADIRAWITAANQESPTQDSFNAMERVLREYYEGRTRLSVIWPTLTHHLDAGKIPDVWAPPERNTRVHCAQRCIKALVLPKMTSTTAPHIPAVLETEADRALMASRAALIFNWTTYMARPYLSKAMGATYSPGTSQDLQLLLCATSLHLLDDARFCVAEAVDTVLTLWQAEANSSRFFRGAPTVADKPSSWALLKLLESARYRTPGGEARFTKLRQKLTSKCDDIISTAIARLDPNVPASQRVFDVAESDETSRGIQVIAALTRIPDVFENFSGGYVCLVKDDLMRVIVHIWASIVVQTQTGKLRYGEGSLKETVLASITYLQHAFTVSPPAYCVPMAMHWGFVTAMYGSSLWLNGGVEPPRPFSIDSQHPTVRFFVEEVILPHMWILSIFEPLLMWSTHNISLRPEDMDRRLLSRLDEWAPMMPAPEAKSPTHCDYSRCTGPRDDTRSKKCSGCGDRMYCSKACQKASWKVSGDDHRSICAPRSFRSCHEGILIRDRDVQFLKSILKFKFSDEHFSPSDQAGFVQHIEKNRQTLGLSPRVGIIFAWFEPDGFTYFLAAPNDCESVITSGRWTDALDEYRKDPDRLMLVGITSTSESLEHRPRAAFCCIPRPHWVPALVPFGE